MENRKNVQNLVKCIASGDETGAKKSLLAVLREKARKRFMEQLEQK